MDEKQEKENFKRGVDIFVLVANLICLGVVLYPALPENARGAIAITDEVLNIQMTALLPLVLVFIFSMIALNPILKLRKKFLKGLRSRYIGLIAIGVGVLTSVLALRLYFAL